MTEANKTPKAADKADQLDPVVMCCAEYQQGVEEIDKFIIPAQLRSCDIKYKGTPFRYCPWCGSPVAKELSLNDRVKRMLKHMNEQSVPIFAALKDMNISELEIADDEIAFALKNNFIKKTETGFLCTKQGVEFSNI